MSNEWPKAMTNRLEVLTKKGLSCTQIAGILNREFGVKLTRNSVVGKQHRKGFKDFLTNPSIPTRYSPPIKARQ